LREVAREEIPNSPVKSGRSGSVRLGRVKVDKPIMPEKQKMKKAHNLEDFSE